MRISVVKETAQYGEQEGKQAWRHVNKEIYGRSTHLVRGNNETNNGNTFIVLSTQSTEAHHNMASRDNKLWP